MEDRTSLSSDERTVIEFCVHRLALGAFGSLATLPLFCLRELPVPDVRDVVQKRYDVWHSHLTVARELLQLKPALFERAKLPLNALFAVVADLRDAFIGISEYGHSPPDLVIAAYARLVSAFDRIAPNVRELDTAIGVDPESILKKLTSRHRYYDNTLQRLGSEIRGRVAIETPEVLSPMDAR